VIGDELLLPPCYEESVPLRVGPRWSWASSPRVLGRIALDHRIEDIVDPDRLHPQPTMPLIIVKMVSVIGVGVVGILVLAIKRARVRSALRVPPRLLLRGLVLTAAACWSMLTSGRPDAHRQHHPQHLQPEADGDSGVAGDRRGADPRVVVHRDLDDGVPAHHGQ
jgi:hypothetical protein